MTNSPLLTVAIFTGSRAEYGLLQHLISTLAAEPSINVELLVSGSHLSERFGLTISELSSDGYHDLNLIPLDLDSTHELSMAQLCSQALSGTDTAFKKLQPHLLVVLGDRYETFAAAVSAHLNRIPIVHLHGGETTSGALDDKLRNAITQLSTWHFTASDFYRKRVVSMSNTPDKVFNIGPMVLDALLQDTEPLSREDFEARTGYVFGLNNIIVTFHPETLSPSNGIDGLHYLLKSLDLIDCNVLFTHPNADEGSSQILDLIQHSINKNPSKYFSVPSLGHSLYLAGLQLFEAVVGNSSSGVIEAPLIGIPTLNIGDRQGGRLHYSSIVTVEASPVDISKGLSLVLNTGQQQSKPRSINLQRSHSPSSKILDWLKDEFKLG